MADKFSSTKRSEIMRKVKGSNTKPELLVRSFLFSKGLRYRLHDKSLPGTPDIKLSKFHCVIMINGCFWHGHACKPKALPKTNSIYWETKILRNTERDKNSIEQLRLRGWRVIIVWECQLTKRIQSQSLNDLYNEIIKD